MKKKYSKITKINLQALSFSFAFVLILVTNLKAQNLDVRGTIKIVDGNQGNGKVLTSDANGLASWKTIGTATYAVGDQALGGTVFYVNSTGTHGLVVANKNQSVVASWYGASNGVNRPTGHDDDGKEFLDWRLPRSWEIQLLYNLFRNDSLPSAYFDYGWYWTSYEDITIGYSPGLTSIWDYGYVMKFDVGYLDFIDKKINSFLNPVRTRAVRAF